MQVLVQETYNDKKQ